MTSLNSRLQQKLQKLDKSTEVRSYKYYTEILSVIDKKNKEKPTKEFEYEIVAFYLMEASKSKSNWGPFYDFFSVIKGKASPSDEYIREDVFIYWRKRSKETSNLVMKERYLGIYTLLFYKVFDKRPPNLEYANLLLQVLKKVHNKNDYKTLKCLEKLLSLVYNRKLEKNILPKLDTILKEFINSSPRLALQLHENNLIRQKKHKELLNSKVVEEFNLELGEGIVVNDLNEYLKGMLDLSIKRNVLANCINRYIEFLNKEEKTFEDMDPLQATFILDSTMIIIHQAYSKEIHLDNSEVIKLKKTLHKLILKYMKSSTPNSFTKTIDMSKTISSLKQIRNVNDVLKLYITENVKSLYKFYLEYNNKERPPAVSDVIQCMSFDSGDYRTRHRSIGSSSLNMSLNIYAMQFSTMLFSMINDHLGLDYAYISDHFLNDNAVFNFTNHSEVVTKILEHYYNKNYIEVMFIVPPLIEYFFRELLEHANYDITKGNPEERVQLKNLSTLLRPLNEKGKDNKEFIKVKDALKKVYSEKSENYIDAVLFYLNHALIDFKGLNLRNNIAHGLVNKDYFDCAKASVLLSCLFLVLILQKEVPNS